MKTKFALALLGTALLSVPAMAQTAPAPKDQHPNAAQMDNRATAPKPAANANANASANGGAALYQMKAGQWRATKLNGLDVYDANNQKIGDLNELIVDRDGRVEAIVVGIGGFLGIGEHDAAIPWKDVKWVDEPVRSNTTASTGTARTTTTTGSGTSAPAAGAGTAGKVTVTPVDKDTVAVNKNAGGSNGAATTTTTDRTTDKMAANDKSNDNAKASNNNNFRPDHAVVNMTKEQLKALPQVRYSSDNK